VTDPILRALTRALFVCLLRFCIFSFPSWHTFMLSQKQVTELNEQLMRAHFEKREGESDKTRAAEEVYRLSQELANSRKALEMKNKELSTALASFADHQKKAEDR